MKVHSEGFVFEALKAGFSLTRFGDGEFKILRGGHGITNLQEYNKALEQKLLKTFSDPLPKLLIGVPNPLGTRPYVAGFYRHFTGFISDQPARTKSIFVSSFFTRPSLVNLDTEMYFKRAKAVWKDRDVVLINFNSNLPDHFLFRDSFCTFIEISRRDCFCDYGEIMASCNKLCGQGKMFLISAGPTANCLVYDLCEKGEHAIDIGQLAFEHSLFIGQPKPERWTAQNTYKLKRGYLRGINEKPRAAEKLC